MTFDEELKSPYLRQYQSYISNWYINGKVFTSTTPWKPENLNFFQNSSKFEFWLLTKSWNHLSFVNISPTLVTDTSMEWSSRVLHHGNPEIWKFFKKFEIDEIEFCPYPEFPYARKKKTPWLRQYQSYISNWYVNGKVFTSTTTWEPKNLIFFSKKFEIEFDLYFDLCWRAEIIQVGLNMHLYVDIGDASSSLWGSTSSLWASRLWVGRRKEPILAMSKKKTMKKEFWQ